MLPASGHLGRRISKFIPFASRHRRFVAKSVNPNNPETEFRIVCGRRTGDDPLPKRQQTQEGKKPHHVFFKEPPLLLWWTGQVIATATSLGVAFMWIGSCTSDQWDVVVPGVRERV